MMMHVKANRQWISSQSESLGGKSDDQTANKLPFKHVESLPEDLKG